MNFRCCIIANVIDVPARVPTRLTCDTCGYTADVAYVLPGGRYLAACWRDRINLPTPDPDADRIERRYGRWYRGSVTVEALVGSEIDLDCEACGGPAGLVVEQRTDDARWQTATCHRCRPVLGAHHSGALDRVLATRSLDGAQPAAWSRTA